MDIGYARVSSISQNLRVQIEALKEAGCAEIFEDKESSVGKLPGRKALLRRLERGDVLTVWKLDRLGRGVADLALLISELRSRGIEIRSLTEPINTTTPYGSYFINSLAALAQLERELTVERTKAGLAAAKRMGRVGGRPLQLTEDKIEQAKQLLSGGITRGEVAKLLGVSVPTLYRHIPGGPR